MGMKRGTLASSATGWDGGVEEFAKIPGGGIGGELWQVPLRARDGGVEEFAKIPGGGIGGELWQVPLQAGMGA